MYKKVFIRAGHGGKDSGAVHNGRQEKDCNLKIALELEKKFLNRGGYDVRLSRRTDVYQPISNIALDANNWGADIVLDMHVNSGGGEGAETLINSVSSEKGKKLAEIVLWALKQSGYRSRGVKNSDRTSIIRQTKAPCTVVEVGFLDNANDMQIFDERLSSIAYNIVAAIDTQYFLPAPTLRRHLYYYPLAKKYSSRLTQTQMMVGTDVQEVQQKIKDMGLDVGGVDGMFGPRTHNGVYMAQYKLGLVKDGIVGEKTAKALEFTWVAL